LPHPPFADWRGDVVDAEAGAGSEGQLVGIIRAERRCRTNRSRLTGKGRGKRFSVVGFVVPSLRRGCRRIGSTLRDQRGAIPRAKLLLPIGHLRMGRSMAGAPGWTVAPVTMIGAAIIAPARLR
jgi:hypothetical protein